MEGKKRTIAQSSVPKQDKSGNYIGDGSYHVDYYVENMDEYPQVKISVSKSDSTESVYVRYFNEENSESITARFSTHENNAVKFGSQLNGYLASKNQILYRLGLKQKRFIPNINKRIWIESQIISKVASEKYDKADITWEELRELPNNTDISQYRNKVVFSKEDNHARLILGDVVKKWEEEDKEFGRYEYFSNGGRTIAQTPAPKKDRVYGSKVNKSDSSKDTDSAKSIKFNDSTLQKIENKVAEHNKKHPNKKISLSSAKAVVRRGMGAYSSSHRPTIKGGKPNSRVAWGLARLNAFLYKIVNGKSKSGKYSQDNDLINELGYKVAKYNEGGLIAPNGKPSNLTPEQYKLVRTKAFKDWFGDWENDPENASKVVDENGEPMVVYHGTDYKFSTFDKNKLGISQGTSPANMYGFYFSNNKIVAKSFGKHFKEFFIKIKKPKTIDLKRKDYSESKYIVNDFVEKINKKYDGGILFNYKDSGGNKTIIANQYVVPNSNQIKLADGTNTTFDGNNSDIRFDVGGNVEDLISKGIVELKMFDTKPEHAKEYGFDVKKPLYVQSICISESERLKGIGKKVLDYIDEYAVKNGHDLIFGHITQKASFTKNSPSDLCDIDLIKEFLIKGGYSTIKGNNDFYKVIKTNPDIRFMAGGNVNDNKMTEKEKTKQLIDDLNLTLEFLSKEEQASTKKLISDLTMAMEFMDDESSDLDVLIAPNGKPSNLTLEQYKLVRTQAFKDWFGDWQNDPANSSKVVDENGEPLVVYHFSDKKFNIFELKGTSEGFFFTENRYDNEFSYEGIVKALDSGNYPQWLKEYIEVTGYSHSKIKKILKPQMRYKKAKAYFLNIKKMFPANRVDKFTKNQWSVPIIENRYIREAKIEGYNGVVFIRKTDKKRIIVAFNPEQIKLADGTNTTFDSNNPDIRFDNGGNVNDNKMSNTRTLTRQEVESMQRIINDPLVSPKLKESFKKVLDSRKVPENADFSRFPEGKYIDPYDFSGYEYMKSRNEEMGVSFLLTGEYELVSKAIFERDYAMWLFYNYLGRVNISFANCQLWIKEAQASFINEMPIQVGLTHQPKAKDGRSYAMWYTCGESQKVISESRLGVKLTFEYNGRWYCNEIGMVGNYDYKGSGWGTLYEEKKTGLLVPEYTETSFHLNTLIHEFAHCYDFQSQLLANIEKYKNKKFEKENKEVDVNTEEMTELEKQLYGASLKDEPLSVSNPITNHFDYFIDSLIKVLRQCASGKIPLTQKFEQQALDVQTALQGTYGDLLLAQREKRRKDAIATQKMDEMRENTRFTWQGKIISEFMKYVEKYAIQREILESLSKKGNQRSFTLSEIIELDNLISQYAKTEFLVFASKNPSKSQALYDDLKDLKVETNRIINNHYDNIRRDYEYGFIPNTDLDKYLQANCDVRDFRDYKSWKECNQSKLSEKMR